MGKSRIAFYRAPYCWFYGVIAILSVLILDSDRVRADPLVVDLSNHLVAITTGFTGTDVLLFGAVQNQGDVVVTVRGPDQDMVVRRKERKMGIWVNSESAKFRNVPAYYATASSRSMDIIANDRLYENYRIGVDHQRFITELDDAERGDGVYREALIRNMRNSGLFNRHPAKISFLSNQLFRTNLHFPANTPTGTYTINVYLIRDGRVASVKTTPLVVSKTGVSAEVYDFAHRYSALYGIIAVIIAVFAGWFASVAFRKS
ncbi:TIGR02186 family protein [Thalassospira sp.]|uniref:TIGR02186 family protein n=1 Tax=Thalassospira sp. TaxID=1912094 RepID=UPI00273738D2|nr:TIGR02186 family protein [Thalassospira sp.]MDP2698171.1 TIGR02186 family protein [Thalassospira sp.]